MYVTLRKTSRVSDTWREKINLNFVSSTQIYLSNQMHNVAIYRIHAYQSPNHMHDHFKTIHHVNKHEIVFHNLEQYANILAHVVNRRVVYLERRIESLAVCMPHMDNKCADFNAKDLTLNAERQRILCAWALTVMPECLKGRIVI